MRVLVTGGSGFLGRFVVKHLRDRHDVTVLDKAPTDADVEFFAADVLNLGAVAAALNKIDAVIHLAAIDAGNPFSDETYFRTNVVGTWNVLHAAENAGVENVVIASSSSVFGVDAESAPEYLPVDEEHPCRPTGVYALSKLLIEKTARSFADRGRMRVVCLRPAHIVRPPTEAPIIVQVALEAGQHERAARLSRQLGVEAYGALPALRGYVRSSDAADAFVRALDFDESDYAVFNVMAPDTMGGCEALDQVRNLYGRDVVVRDEPRFRTMPAASLFDANSARDKLGWQARGLWSDLSSEHGSHD